MLNNFIVKKSEDKPKPVQKGISVKCYAAILSKMHDEFPEAHFEIVMRAPKSVGLNCQPSILSPSYELLKRVNEGSLTFEEYTTLLKQELLANAQAIQRVKELGQIAQTKLVFLVCQEPNPNECHRSLLKNWIENIQDFIPVQVSKKDKQKIEFPELTEIEMKVWRFIKKESDPFPVTIWTISNWCNITEKEAERIGNQLVKDEKYHIHKVRHHTAQYALEYHN